VLEFGARIRLPRPKLLLEVRATDKVYVSHYVI